MQPPSKLLQRGVNTLFCIGDGRQSGTSASPSILNASPEASAGGNLAIFKDGDKLRIDLRKRRINILIDDEELKRRKLEDEKHGYPTLPGRTPWQEIFRQETDQLSTGMVLRKAVKYQRLAQQFDPPRHNH
ncbi:hypothetical protein FSARC_12639 [Fusarium sarcochroum]|uniref:Dihydroxy-acid/6-phosphogluconate dehydratase C-terminal domain-containing protein n=1 Tax=Fusarium sarcochroum TaxID=1208366 RepID=A0A8H4WWJ4_9HYPO|nr:hypothetical protein FSARC_12639 [Fusarium sarcochroum]